MAKKTKPIGVRFNEDVLTELQKAEGIKTPQQAITYLSEFWKKHNQNAKMKDFKTAEEALAFLSEYWKNHEIAFYKPTEGKNPYDSDLLITNEDEPPPYKRPDPAGKKTELEKQILAILNEPLPNHIKTSIGKKVWMNEKRKRIDALKTASKNESEKKG